MNELAPTQTPQRARLKRILLYTVGILTLLFIGIQFVPVEAKENPVVVADFEENTEVEAILRRACYDCHSNEVKWPWYASVAPVSWLVGSDVIEGRKAFNFSEWPEDEDDRQFNRETALEQVVDGEMPPWFYLPMHPEAKLTEQDMAVLKAWGAEKEEEEEEEEADSAEKEEANEAAPQGSAPQAADQPASDEAAEADE